MRYGINWLLKYLSISPNGYYNYKKQRKNAEQKKKASTLKIIKKLYHEAGGRPGYRMMKQLLANQGITLSELTVHMYMNVELELKSVTRKPKYRYYKGPPPYAVFDNLINQQFRAKKRNTRWCIDFTYLFLANRSKRYNCSIIDLYDRRIVASFNSNRINAKLAIDTLTKAIKSTKGATGIILHSDRGSQFTSKDFVKFCKQNHIIQSMSRPGCPYDNAPIERYFSTLKSELINLRTFKTESKLYEEVNAYAYGWYNNLRPHSFNNGIPPAKVA